MSISSNKQYFDLVRTPNTIDALGVVGGEPVQVSLIQVSVFRNTPIQDYKSPQYDMTEFVGITDYHDVRIGDILKGVAANDYLVKNLGDRGRMYTSLFLEKL